MSREAQLSRRCGRGVASLPQFALKPARFFSLQPSELRDLLIRQESVQFYNNAAPFDVELIAQADFLLSVEVAVGPCAGERRPSPQQAAADDRQRTLALIRRQRKALDHEIGTLSGVGLQRCLIDAGRRLGGGGYAPGRREQDDGKMFHALTLKAGGAGLNQGKSGKCQTTRGYRSRLDCGARLSRSRDDAICGGGLTTM